MRPELNRQIEQTSRLTLAVIFRRAAEIMRPAAAGLHLQDEPGPAVVAIRTEDATTTDPLQSAGE